MATLCQLLKAVDDFHTVVLYGGFGGHVLVLQPQSQGKSPLFLFVEPLGGITFNGNGDARCVAVYLAYLLGQGNGRCTADIESGFNVVFPTVQIGVDNLPKAAAVPTAGFAAPPRHCRLFPADGRLCSMLPSAHPPLWV